MLRGIAPMSAIIATARDDETEIVRLLNDGADDYLTKPFSVEHLSARMAAVLRRSRATGTPPPRRSSGSAACPSIRCAARPSWTAPDWPHPARVRPARVLLGGPVSSSRADLFSPRCGSSPYRDDQTIDVHLSWLRRKLGETAARPRYLHTLPGSA